MIPGRRSLIRRCHLARNLYGRLAAAASAVQASPCGWPARLGARLWGGRLLCGDRLLADGPQGFAQGLFFIAPDERVDLIVGQNARLGCGKDML